MTIQRLTLSRSIGFLLMNGMALFFMLAFFSYCPQESLYVYHTTKTYADAVPKMNYGGSWGAYFTSYILYMCGCAGVLVTPFFIVIACIGGGLITWPRGLLVALGLLLYIFTLAELCARLDIEIFGGIDAGGMLGIVSAHFFDTYLDYPCCRELAEIVLLLQAAALIVLSIFFSTVLPKKNIFRTFLVKYKTKMSPLGFFIDLHTFLLTNVKNKDIFVGHMF